MTLFETNPPRQIIKYPLCHFRSKGSVAVMILHEYPSWLNGGLLSEYKMLIPHWKVLMYDITFMFPVSQGQILCLHQHFFK